MAQTLEVKRYGGTVTFSATSDPNPPILTFSSTGNTWASRNGEVITIAANNSASGRSFDITVTATTSANTSYDGIASAYSAYTITQEGTGILPGNSIPFVFAATEDFGDFTISVRGSGIPDDSPTKGTSDTGDLGSSSIPDGASISLGVQNGTSETRSIGVDYTSSSPSYSYTSVSSGSWTWVNVTQASGKIFYVRVE